MLGLAHRLGLRALHRVRTGSLLMAAVLAGLLPAGGAAAAERGYIVTDFDSLRLEAPIDVSVQTGRGVSAHGTGDRDLLDRLELAVSARTLTIRLKPSPFEGSRRGDAGVVRLTLTVPALRRINLSGAGTLRATGMDRGEGEIISAGNGAMTVTGIASDRLSVAQYGAGSVTLSGRAQAVMLRVTGSGTLDAQALDAADLDLTLEGNASVQARASRAAKLVAVGAGSATVTGRGACTVRHAGSGIVRCGEESY